MTAARTALGALFIVIGCLHFAMPGYFIAAMPSYIPAAAALVALSGVAEIAGGVGLMITRLRAAAGIGLIALLIAVFPANVEMLRQARERDASTLFQAALWMRLPFQPLLIWAVWRLSRPDPAVSPHPSRTPAR